MSHSAKCFCWVCSFEVFRLLKRKVIVLDALDICKIVLTDSLIFDICLCLV